MFWLSHGLRLPGTGKYFLISINYQLPRSSACTSEKCLPLKNIVFNHHSDRLRIANKNVSNQKYPFESKSFFESIIWVPDDAAWKNVSARTSTWRPESWNLMDSGPSISITFPRDQLKKSKVEIPFCLAYDSQWKCTTFQDFLKIAFNFYCKS